MSNLLSHIGSGLIGAGVMLIGTSIYIKNYYENSGNIEQQCYPKKPTSELKMMSPLYISKPTEIIPNLDLPVLHDFAKLENTAQDAEEMSAQLQNTQENNFVATACLNLVEKHSDLSDNTILLMADMKKSKLDA